MKLILYSADLNCELPLDFAERVLERASRLRRRII